MDQDLDHRVAQVESPPPVEATDPFDNEIERGQMRVRPLGISQLQNVAVGRGIMNRGGSRPRDKGAELQPSWFMKRYVDQKRLEILEKDNQQNHRPHGPLLIGWYDEEDREIPELNDGEEGIARAVLDTWTRSQQHPEQQRATFYAQKWRSIVRQRQLDRENRHETRNKSETRSIGSRTRSESKVQRRSPDFAAFRRTPIIRDGGLRGTSRSSRRSAPGLIQSPRKFNRRVPPRLDRHDGHFDSRNASPDLPSTLRGAQSRSSSHVRARPVKMDFEYGDTPVVGTYRQAFMDPGSRRPASPAQNEGRAHSRVGFQRTIQVIVSSGEDTSSESGNESLVEEASPASRKDSSGQHRETYDPPPKSILKPPRQSFPEEPNPVREGVARLTYHQGTPAGARWTKIDRRLVSPAVLDAGHERYEETPNYVIVLRVLQKEEIQEYALKTELMRGE